MILPLKTWFDSHIIVLFILLVTLNCGGESSENCTYFDSSTTVAPGACKAKVCKCSTDIWCATLMPFLVYLPELGTLFLQNITVASILTIKDAGEGGGLQNDPMVRRLAPISHRIMLWSQKLSINISQLEVSKVFIFNYLDRFFRNLTKINKKLWILEIENHKIMYPWTPFITITGFAILITHCRLTLGFKWKGKENGWDVTHQFHSQIRLDFSNFGQISLLF